MIRKLFANALRNEAAARIRWSNPNEFTEEQLIEFSKSLCHYGLTFFVNNDGA